MFTRIKDFEYWWPQQIEKTQKVMKHLNDRSLAHEVAPGARTLGRIAWHVVQTIPEMMSHTGLKVEGPSESAPVPTSARVIARAYDESAQSLLKEVASKWTDETLEVKDQMYGQVWKRGDTLAALIFHEIHHRGQMIVLMRQAGIKVPGVYGPAKEEWALYGMPVPEV
ncbi:MAG: DinB family protein [Acidobacteriota bacterium]